MTIKDGVLTVLITLAMAFGAHSMATESRLTALESKSVSEAQFLELMNKLDKRLTIMETLLENSQKESN
ncbi:hypothetical protein [Endozoicomonas sp. SESOKO1]|uniref:hypothetical protein n=1 Tax=Endozoicomonas sp. SESOKO1 TaxID=2828742 RepID=UPI0021485683|nr:hypothetical protein [Endozoicomonas sp. SESOKO1]